MKRKKLKYHYSFLMAGALVFLAGACLLQIGKNKAEAAPNSTVYINPASTSATLNEAFNVGATINPGTNSVSAVDLRIVFDRTKLRLNSITPNTSAFSDLLQAPQIDNNNGTGSVVLSTGGSATGYVTTTSVMATLNFTPIADGSSVVNLTGTMAAAQGEGGDVITTRTGGTVAVENHVTYGIADFQNLVTDWLKSMSGSPADVNSDNLVNSRDLGIMMTYWLE